MPYFLSEDQNLEKMNVIKQDFILLLSKVLDPVEYVLMSGDIGQEQFLINRNRLEILVFRRDLPRIIEGLKAHSVNEFQLVKGYRASQMQLSWRALTFEIEWLHKLTSKSLILLDEKMVMDKRIFCVDRLTVPSIEHLFDHLVVNSILNRRGISDPTYRYFSDFHVVLQEDLVEYFNENYGTKFTAMHQLTNFEEENRLLVLKTLKARPANQLLRNLDLRWSHFFGNLRQAKIF